jgi:hypothetical protein
MYGSRVVVPVKFRQRVLKQLHKAHPGMENTKALATSYVYWPNIDSDIESMIKKCHECAVFAKNPPKMLLHSWPKSTKPWERIHVDYAGPLDGFYFLIVVDSYSKWPSIFHTKTTTSSKTIHMMNGLFYIFGSPENFVSDNGSQFASQEF